MSSVYTEASITALNSLLHLSDSDALVASTAVLRAGKEVKDVYRGGRWHGSFRPIPLKNSVLEPECHVIKQLEPRLFDKG